MNVVVTGPSGHIGVNLVRHLIDAGHHVRAVCFDEATTLDGLDVERVPGDVCDKSSLLAAFEGQDLLFHLAGIIAIDRGREALLHRVNVTGAQNAAEAALEAGVKRMVHVSSIHALELHGDGPVTEDVGPCSGPRCGAYDLSKAAGEAAVRTVGARGLEVVVIYPTAVIGPHDYGPSLSGQFLIAVGQGTYPALVEGGFDWVDVRDVVAGALSAAQRGVAGEGYLLGGSYAPVSALAQIAASAVGRRAPRFSAPVWLARAAVPFLRMGSAVTGRRATITRHSVDTLANHTHVDFSKARRDLGYEPRTLEDTLSATMRWYVEAGMLGHEEVALASK